MNRKPAFQCSKSGDDLLQIAQTFRSAVAGGLIERERKADGVQFIIRRSPVAQRKIHEFVRREKECCPFFNFEVAEHDDEVSLAIKGPAEAGALLDLLYQLAKPAAPPAS